MPLTLEGVVARCSNIRMLEIRLGVIELGFSGDDAALDLLALAPQGDSSLGSAFATTAFVFFASTSLPASSLGPMLL